MSEQEQVDRWLLEAMANSPAPRLSPEFDARLRRQLRPRRLTAAGRFLMAGYVILSILISAWAMRSVTLDWEVTLASFIALVLAAMVYGRRLVTSWSR